MFVQSTAVLYQTPGSLKNLNARVKEQTGLHFRRVNRFILLAISGAHDCATEAELHPETGVWLTTENGTVGDTEKGLDQLFNQRIFPKPYNFINTMSNTAAFYIAQSLKLSSTNITLSCKDFSFERGLTLARADLRRQAAPAALIGGVDEAVFSETNLKSRFGDRLIDGSAWLYVSADPAGARGRITEIRDFDNQAQALAWLETAPLGLEPVLTFGVRISDEARRQWISAIPGAAIFDPIGECGFCDSAPAMGMCLFFQNFKNKTCLHLNKDQSGRYVLVVAEVF